MRCLVCSAPYRLRTGSSGDNDIGHKISSRRVYASSSYVGYEFARLRPLLQHHGHEVVAFDFSISNIETILDAIHSFKPDVVLIDANIYQDHTERHNILDFFYFLKRKLKSIKTVWGGRDAAALAGYILTHNLVVDVVLCDESNSTLPGLLSWWDSQGIDAPLDGIKGLAFSKNGVVNFTGRLSKDELIDLDDLPFPDYGAIQLPKDEVPLVMSAVGCPYDCRFCYRQYRYYREHSTGYFIRLLKYLSDLKINKIKIEDELFTLDRNRCLEICDMIIQQGINIEYECYSRVDKFDESIAHALQNSGCKKVWFGVETGDEHLLKLMNKSQNIYDITSATLAAKKHGLSVCWNLLLGFPGETERSIYSTLKLMIELRPDDISVQRMKINPKTQAYNLLKEKNIYDDEMWILNDRDFSYERDFSKDGLDTLAKLFRSINDLAKSDKISNELLQYFSLKGETEVCQCYSVTKSEIISAFKDGCDSLGKIKDFTSAMSGCGGCTGIVKTILDAYGNISQKDC